MLKLFCFVFASVLLICNVDSQESTTSSGGFFNDLFKKGQDFVQKNPALVQQAQNFAAQQFNKNAAATTTTKTTLYPDLGSFLSSNANSPSSANTANTNNQPDFQKFLQNAPQLLAAGQSLLQKFKSNPNPQQSATPVQQNVNQNFAQQSPSNPEPAKAAQNTLEDWLKVGQQYVQQGQGTAQQYQGFPSSSQAQQNIPSNPETAKASQSTLERWLQVGQQYAQQAQDVGQKYQAFQEFQNLVSPAPQKQNSG